MSFSSNHKFSLFKIIGTCLSTEYKCVDSPQCIPKVTKGHPTTCNSLPDCSDGSDEDSSAGCSKFNDLFFLLSFTDLF